MYKHLIFIYLFIFIKTIIVKAQCTVCFVDGVEVGCCDADGDTCTCPETGGLIKNECRADCANCLKMGKLCD